MPKYILVTNATGKQGRAVIAALSHNPTFHLLAATRNPTSPHAQSLLKTRPPATNITLIPSPSPLIPSTVPTLLATAKSHTAGAGLHGIYSVQVSPGQPEIKNVTIADEIALGKAIVDASIDAGVRHFVYGSVDRGGDEASWEKPTEVPHFASKWEIERYLRQRAEEDRVAKGKGGGEGMMWTILRPTAFMEGIVPGFGTKVFMAVLRDGLDGKEGRRSKLAFVATKDVGVFARLAFEDPEKWNGKAVALAGDELSAEEIAKVVKETTGEDVKATWSVFGSALRLVVKEVKLMVDWFATEGYAPDIPALRKAHPGLLDLKTWLREESTFPKKA